MTPLTKKVTRRSDAAIVRDEGKLRRIVVMLYPGGLVGLRPEKTRREEFMPLSAAWSLAVKMRVARERADKRAAKKASAKDRIEKAGKKVRQGGK